MKRNITITKRTITTPTPVARTRNVLPLRNEKKRISISKLEPITTTSIEGLQVSPKFSNLNAEPFEALSGITNEKPEIIALTDFIPCYLNDGTLNETGNFLQIKQDALLVSCVDSIKNILELIKEEKSENEAENIIKNYLQNKTAELFSFCTTIDTNITSFLLALNDTKKAFDIKRNFYYEIDEKQGIPVDLDANKNNASLNDLLNTQNNILNNWTSTKIWLQLCKRFHDALQFGVWRSAEDTSTTSVINSNSQNSYQLYTPNFVEKKLKFNTQQINLFQIFKTNQNITSTNIDNLKNQLTQIFSTNSILNYPMKDLIGDDENQRSKNIARLCQLITREIRYSTELRKLKYINPEILSIYNYPTANLDVPNNSSFWSFVVGQMGNDITEIPSQPTSTSTLTSLAQRIEIKNGKSYEILSFENSYINDDVTSSDQTNRSSTLTPGPSFYVDGILDKEPLFDPSAIDAYIPDVNYATSALKTLFSSNKNLGSNTLQFLLDKNIKPRSLLDIINFNVNTPGSEVFWLLEENMMDIIKNPMFLIRYLEDRLLNERYLARFKSPPVADKKDISPALLNFALENIDSKTKNSHLLTLIYTYIALKADSFTQQDLGNTSSSNDTINIVLTSIKKYFIDYYENNRVTYKNEESTIIDLDNAISSNNLITLNNIAKILASINKEFNKLDPEIPDPSDADFNPSPFNHGTDYSRTFYNGIQKESILTLVFFLCCLLIQEANPNSIIGFQKERSTKFNLIVKTKKQLVAQTIDVQSVQIPGYSFPCNVYDYDKTIELTEKLLWNDAVDIKNIASWFVSFMCLLQNKLKTFHNSLISDNFETKYYDPILARLGDRTLASKVFSIEQLNLLKSKLSYLKTRLSPEYNSGLKMLVPYFVSFQKEESNIINACLPIEDVHLVAWNFFLKDYLKQQEFLEPFANNKKIISVGLPHKLYDRLQKFTSASTIQNSSEQANLVSINIYLKDNLRPQLIHKPQKFIFDLNKFTVRTLNYYLDSAIGTINKIDDANFNDNKIDEQEYEFLKFLPFFDLKNFQDAQNIRADDAHDLLESINNNYGKLQRYISPQEFENLRKNHIKNFFLEEYLRFITGHAFDEHNFTNYSKLAVGFNDSSIVYAPVNTPGAVEYFKNTIFGDIDSLQKNLITPKKFDRVFHLIVDPDDFEIDESKTTSINPSTIEYFTKSGIIKKEENDKLKRIATKTSAVEINSYFAELEIIA